MGYRSKYTGSQLENILDNAQNKQDKISDLETIRSGARKGATALQSVPSEYVTESELSNKGYATISALNNKVDKVSGKQLSTEDFTTALKSKLEGLNNYDGAELSNAISTLRGDFDKLVSGDTTTAIKTFNEVIAFLDGLTDTQDLESIIASIEQQIAGKADDNSVVHTAGTETITGVKTFNGRVNFLGSGDSNAMYLSTNTRLNVDGTTNTVLGFSSGTFLINNAAYNLTLRGKGTRPTYNSTTLALSSDIPSAVTESTVSGWGFTKNAGTYSKPSGGIPKTDLASAVQTSLGKADTALQSYTEQYKGTVTGVKVNGTTKNPSNGVVDLGTVITAHQTLKTINGQAIEGVGNITISGGEADWNAAENEDGYIANKPFYSTIYDIIDVNTSTYDEYDIQYTQYSFSYEYGTYGPYIYYKDFYGDNFINISDYNDGAIITIPIYDGVNSIESEYYFELEKQENTDSEGYIIDYEYILRTYDDYVPTIIYDYSVKQINDIYIPDTVIKTTPQILSETDKNQALSNLGLSNVANTLTTLDERVDVIEKTQLKAFIMPEDFMEEYDEPDENGFQGKVKQEYVTDILENRYTKMSHMQDASIDLEFDYTILYNDVLRITQRIEHFQELSGKQIYVIEINVNRDSVDFCKYKTQLFNSVFPCTYSIEESKNSDGYKRLEFINSVITDDTDLPEENKQLFKKNMGSFADWNATEGEAGYIANKPGFYFESIGETAFYYDEYYQSIVWDNPSIGGNYNAIQILDYDNNPKYIDMENKTDGGFGNMDNIFVNGTLHYKWINDVLCIEPDYVFDDEEDKQYHVDLLNEYSTAGILVKIDEIYLPNTVLKTTPQSLTDAQKQQILENLGISGGGVAGANVMAVDTGDVVEDVNISYATTDYVDGLIGDINSILESIING